MSEASVYPPEPSEAAIYPAPDISVVVDPTPTSVVIVSTSGTPGISAYQQAVLAGYAGTEAEWLESLKGAPGPSGQSYVHEQTTPATEWTIHHNLGIRPNVTVVDSAGSLQVGEPEYVDANTLVLRFLAGFAGTAYVS